MPKKKLPGEERMRRPSIRVAESTLEAFDEWCNKHEKSRTGALVEYMENTIRDKDMENTIRDKDTSNLTPRAPPTEPHLRYGYKRLCMVSSSGYVTDETARRVVPGGSYNLSKSEAIDLVLRPLQKRGYLGRDGNALGDSSWKIRGWDE